MADEGRGNGRTALFVADYPPRQCGIATFTADLVRAVAGAGAGDVCCGVLAINDLPEGYRYNDVVRFEIRENAQEDYRQAAEFINISDASVVCLQHEYGIFGGRSGSHILAMLRRLRRPLVTTLHTVLDRPNDDQRRILVEIARMSTRLIVMARRAEEFLRDVYDVPAEKVVMIPHGIPDVPFMDPTYYKDKFGVEGRRVILTFGLLSPNKGLETAIAALPAVVSRHPEAVYVIVGATHPAVRRQSGEEYRIELQRLARDLGVERHVIFHNRFVEPEELREFLCATDIYVTPYLNEAQITSGTLAYAMGAGTAIVSTPYWYAQEVLAEGRGRLVEFRDSHAISEALLELLDDTNLRDAMRKRAYQYSRGMVWAEVGRRYLEVFAEAQARPVRPVTVALPPAVAITSGFELPEVDLRHFRLLTDETGMLQHSLYATPDRRHGYTTDDNARALIVAANYWHQTQDESLLPQVHRYLAFLTYALNHQTGRFRNFMNYDRTWCEEVGSEDAHGRALWGLGMAAGLCRQEPVVALVTRLFERALPAVEGFTSPRAWAFTIVGLHGYLMRFSGDSEARRCRVMLSERLFEAFRGHMTDEWPWCEDLITYCNAILPRALIMSGRWTPHAEMLELGKRCLRWLVDVQTDPTGHITLIGNDGWFTRDGKRARFDQQCVEAQTLLEACLEAYNVTGEDAWLRDARRCFNWFLGDNDIQMPLYDFTTGGCRDGIHADRPNQNQGAESTLAWLCSLLAMHDAQAQTLAPLVGDGQKAVVHG
jgi:glycosyltransferase involved in cell wall biosynthesis